MDLRVSRARTSSALVISCEELVLRMTSFPKVNRMNFLIWKIRIGPLLFIHIVCILLHFFSITIGFYFRMKKTVEFLWLECFSISNIEFFFSLELSAYIGTYADKICFIYKTKTILNVRFSAYIKSSFYLFIGRQNLRLN